MIWNGVPIRTLPLHRTLNLPFKLSILSLLDFHLSPHSLDQLVPLTDYRINIRLHLFSIRCHHLKLLTHLLNPPLPPDLVQSQTLNLLEQLTVLSLYLSDLLSE